MELPIQLDFIHVYLRRESLSNVKSIFNLATNCYNRILKLFDLKPLFNFFLSCRRHKTECVGVGLDLFFIPLILFCAPNGECMGPC